MSSPVDGLRRHFGLENRRNWLRLIGQSAFDPLELGCVQSRQLDHGNVDFAFVMKQLSAERLGEAEHRVLSRAIGRLQGNTSIRESGADLHDPPSVPRKHMSKSR